MSLAKDLDQYYTREDVAKACIEVMLNHSPSGLQWIEPSAGCGAFLFEGTTRAYDIDPKHRSVIKADWLSDRVILPVAAYGVYGNPPYGKRNALSKRFIEKSISDINCKVVAFLLPTAWNKHTLQKVFPPDWSLCATYSPEADSFVHEGMPYKIPCIFQVWVRQEYANGINLRAQERKNFDNEHFEIVKNGGDLFVMGAAPKTTKLPAEVQPNNRGYWLKAKIPVDILRKNLQNCRWSGNSSAGGGVFWLTKTEFIDAYERCYLQGC